MIACSRLFGRDISNLSTRKTKEGGGGLPSRSLTTKKKAGVSSHNKQLFARRPSLSTTMGTSSSSRLDNNKPKHLTFDDTTLTHDIVTTPMTDNLGVADEDDLLDNDSVRLPFPRLSILNCLSSHGRLQ